jgi:hypothetical protein
MERCVGVTRLLRNGDGWELDFLLFCYMHIVSELGLEKPVAITIAKKFFLSSVCPTC